MTLLGAILRRVQSTESTNKYRSPPPELNDIRNVKRKRKIHKYQYGKVSSKVDVKPYKYNAYRQYRNFASWSRNALTIYQENLQMVNNIKRIYNMGGKVDSHWRVPPIPIMTYYHDRVMFYKRLEKENQILYKFIKETRPKIIPTATLNKDWKRNRREIVNRAQFKFLLFPPTPEEIMEDRAFAAPSDVSRPRAQITVGIREGAVLGTITVELFTDVCPSTCKLFLELLDGDGLGYGYVGTKFFRKVPNLYWSGGDVILDNGFGCYMQRGRRAPIPAENFHFSHSMPGILSMRVTADDEVCAIFNITFKPMPQFDLRNVVFGRVIRPSSTYDAMQCLGSPLNIRPIVEICSSKRRVYGKWVHGRPNSVIKK